MTTTYFDLEVRFFSRTTGLRLAYNPDTLLKVDWELVESGGSGQATITFAGLFDATAVASPGDTVEIWVLGESVARYRGQIAQPEALLDVTESHNMVAYGRMEDMNHVLLDKILLIPGGADLSVFAASIADDYAARRPNLTFTRDIQVVGASLERFDLGNTTARDGLTHLQEQAANNAVWGWDIDPVSGKDRFYFRPRVSTVGYQFYVGGNVRYVHAPIETQAIVNAGKVEGGPAKYPNLLTNGSFEVPELPSEADVSLLTNGGFEDATGWTYTGGAIRATVHNGGYNASAHSGLYYGVLLANGSEVWQEATVTPGTPYNASLYASRQNGAYAALGNLTVEGRNASGTVIETYSLSIAPPSTTWTGGQPSTVLASDGISLTVTFGDATITHARVRVIGTSITSSQALLIDDVVFAASSFVAQKAWYANGRDGSTLAYNFAWIDWACRAAANDGYYGVRASVTPHIAYIPVIEPIPGLYPAGRPGYHFQPAPQQQLRTSAWIRMAPGLNSAAGSIRVEYIEFAADGHETQRSYNASPSIGTFSIPNDGAWHYCSVDTTAHYDAATGSMGVTFATAGVYDLDMCQVRDVAAGDDFLRGTAFEKCVRSDSTATIDAVMIATIGAAARASIATYDLRESLISNNDIVDWGANSQAWVGNYFNLHAVPLVRPQLELTHEPVQIITPGSGQQVRVSGLVTDVADVWCARSQYTWDTSALKVQIEMGSERPTVAKLLLSAAGGGSGGGSTSSISAIAGSGGGGTTSTPAAGITVEDASGNIVSNTTTLKMLTGTVAASSTANEADYTPPAASSDHKVILNVGDGSPDYLDAKTAAAAPITVTDAAGVRTFGISAATTGAAGSLSAADKTKLDGIATGATNTPLATSGPAAEGVNSAQALGASTMAARADHVHAMPATWTPSAHHTTHENGGTDQVSLDASQITTGIIPSTMVAVGTLPDHHVVITSNINIASPGAIYDSITLGTPDTVLLVAQTTASQNGPYLYHGAGVALTRPAFYLTGNTVQAYSGVSVRILSGTLGTGQVWRISSPGAITIDTTATTWVVVQVAASSITGSVPLANVALGAPVPADSITVLQNTATAPNQLLATAINVATTVAASAGDDWEWETSVNAGSTWSSSVFTGQVMPFSLASGTVRFRCRLNGANGSVTAWATTADYTFVTPSTGGVPSGSAGGDLTGTYPNPTLAGIVLGGTIGDASHVPQITYDSKGRVTGASAIAITAASSFPAFGMFG